MGEVYLARDTRLNRSAALKVLPAEVASNQDRIRRFDREAKAASALNHPNVATIYEIGEDNGISFIAMEYVEGQTLASKLRAGQLDSGEMIDIGLQVIGAIEAAHAKGITHRDIKPGNIMITPAGQVKILDFGLAKVGPSEEETLGSDMVTADETMPGIVMGTVQYMS